MTETSVDGFIGSIVQDRYTIEALIGRGGMASVYRARDVTLNRPVALKVFRADASESDALRRQRSEIELLASLNHPSLVTLFDAGVETDDGNGGHGFIAMELIDGENLSRRLKSGALPAQHVDSIAAALADAVCHIHMAGVIHRDVKPANILLIPSEVPGAAPRVKLADFGIALLVDVPRLTEVGAVLGTASYLSPEQALGQNLSSATDVYSLGLVLLECLTGERAFPGTAVESASARVLRSPVIPVSLPGGWGRLLTAMTARDPAERPSALDIVQAFAQVPHPSAVTGSATETLEMTQAMTQATPQSLPPSLPQSLPPGPAESRAHTMQPNEQPTLDLTTTPLAEDQATRILQTVPDAAESDVAAQDAIRTQMFAPPANPDVARHAPQQRRSLAEQQPLLHNPSPRPGPNQPHRKRGPVGLLVAIVVIALVLAGGAFALSSWGGPANTAAPSYPSVPGDLGTHLQELQENIEP